MVAEEVSKLLRALPPSGLVPALDLLGDAERRWFVTGQGRSGLVASMAAMRLMHLGRRAHVLGEVTCPSLAQGDGLLVVSRSGETAVSLHLARTATGLGARLLVVTAAPDSTLARLADAVLVVPAGDSRQFAGSLVEQGSLLLLDALVHQLSGEPPAHDAMSARHANVQ